MEIKNFKFHFDSLSNFQKIVYSCKNSSNKNSKFLFIILILTSLLQSGCKIDQSTQKYENSKSGISLEKPSNWEATYTERDGLVTLSAKNRLWDGDSSRIEIYGNACRPSNVPWLNSIDEITSDIDRIRVLYGLDEITYSQEPNEYIVDDYEIVMAAITIPIKSMKNDPNRIQIDHQDQNTFQTIELYAITNNHNGTIGYVYRGEDDQLNKQAREIIESIRFQCTSTP